MTIVMCLVGMVLLNHSCLMLLNKNISSKKTLKECVIFTLVSNIIGIIALFLSGFSITQNVIVEVMLIVPFVIGLIVYSIKREELNKYKQHKQKEAVKNRKKKK